MIREIIKKIVLKTPFLLDKFKRRELQSGKYSTYEEHIKRIDDADKVLLSEKSFSKDFKVGLVKDDVFKFDDAYIHTRSYFPKYERFLKNNNIDYGYFDINASNWIEEAKQYDMIIWHTASDPCTQKIAKSKFYILDKIMKKECLPSFDEIWGYEDKINAHYLYKTFELPEIPTFVSHSKKDIISFLEETKYPIISKLSTGSASFGVEKLNTKNEALKIVDQIFSSKGRKTYFPFESQKDYVYFQQFVDDATYDLRIITIGDKALGYYRFPNEGDFRASGAGNYAKKEIPAEALDLAFQVKAAYGATCLATDLLYSEKNKKYYIIESSIFIGVDTPRQLEIDGISGYYERITDGQYSFVKGKYWIQELTLKELLERM